MAVGYNPRIVTDGLVLAYDETNPKSGITSELRLGRSATTSGSTRNFSQDSLLETMYADVAQYNSSAAGTGFSLSTWIKRTGNTSGNWDTLITIDSGGPRYRMIWFGFYNNQTSQIHCSVPYYSATDTSSYWSVDPTWTNAGVSFNTNEWYNVCATYNNSTRVLSTYIDGNFALSGTRPGAGDLNNPNNADVKLYGTNQTSYANSQLTAVNFYNKPLTSQEVLQNFNALKGRFKN